MNPFTIKESRIATDLVVLKSKLESEGITCFMKDELSTQVLNYLQSNTVKLQVDKDDVERALHIMNGTDNPEDEKTISCPNCGTGNVKIVIPFKARLKNIFYFSKSSLTFSYQPIPKYKMKYKCKSCKTKFENNHELLQNRE
ncbi:putative signal transducing protein [Bacteroidota bacterium]